MKILAIEPIKKPRVMEIENTLKSMQKIVGGYIQVYDTFADDNAVIVCNEEGKIYGLPPNRAIKDQKGNIQDIIYGTFFICQTNIRGEFEELSEALIDVYTKKFTIPGDKNRLWTQILLDGFL